MPTMTTAGTAAAATALTAIAGPGAYDEKLAIAATSGVFILPVGAVGGETVVTTAQKAAFRAPFPFVITGLRASVVTVSSSGIPTFDVNKNGVTVMPTTKLTIDATEKTSVTAAVPYALSATLADYTFADDDELTIDVDVAGTSTAGARVAIYYTRLG